MPYEAVENIVNLLIKRENISELPVDIHKLTSKYAQLDFFKIPFSFDGITIKEKNKRPHIIINENAGSRRQRFTLAHELGHIIIPWHIGIIIDQSIDEKKTYDHEYGELEAEANRFASFLLLPSKIIGTFIDKSLKNNQISLSELIQRLAAKAETSLLTTTFRVIKLLPPDFAYFVLDSDNVCIYKGSSRETKLRLPNPGKKVEIKNFFDKTHKRSSIITDQFKFYFYTFLLEEVNPEYVENKEWREILNEILSRSFNDKEQRARWFKKLNARIGSFYGSCLKRENYSFEKFYELLYNRLFVYGDMGWLLKDPGFKVFINRKISDLFDK